MIYKSFLIEDNINNLKNNIVLFYGENLGLLDDLKNKIINKNSKKRIIRYTQEEVITNKSKLLEEIYNISLFEEEKIFIITNVSDKILTTIVDIKPQIDSNNLYLFGGSLEKKSKLRKYFENENNLDLVPCYKDDSNNIKRIVANYLKDFTNTTPQIINIIVDACSNDRAKVNNEIVKIKSFFKNKNIILNDLIKLLNFREDEDFSLLRDTSLNGDNRHTNKLLNTSFIENEKIIFYISMINYRLTNLKKISDQNVGDVNQLVEKMKPPIFWKEKKDFIYQAKKWNSKKILKALDITYSTEVCVKSKSYFDKKIIFKKLIIDICNLANAA